MDRRLSLVADERLARRVNDLAREYDLPTEEVLRQLVEVGLAEIEGTTRGVRGTVQDGVRVEDD